MIATLQGFSESEENLMVSRLFRLPRVSVQLPKMKQRDLFLVAGESCPSNFKRKPGGCNESYLVAKKGNGRIREGRRKRGEMSLYGNHGPGVCLTRSY